ncbi:TPA: hypothetical protein HA249_03855 [Candidatus Woesearchaeota archaeon]|nr:hypothetical protein [Candidatus Woesearchaeota archaeon]HIH46963.1 hypothetical protein [Candidatus Woesearchaeota archaeon]HII89078.1 hypothetical protein [Candidatus Woesearchaeota archaeon]
MVLQGRVRGKDIVTERYGHFPVEGWGAMTPVERARINGRHVKFSRVTDTRFSGKGTIKSVAAGTADQHVRELGRITEIVQDRARSRSLSTLR